VAKSKEKEEDKKHNRWKDDYDWWDRKFGREESNTVESMDLRKSEDDQKSLVKVRGSKLSSWKKGRQFSASS